MTHYFDGAYDNHGNDHDGVRANIEVDSPDLCDDSNGPITFSSAWTMLAEDGGDGGYAQVGWIKRRLSSGDSTRDWFAQWAKNGDCPNGPTCHTVFQHDSVVGSPTTGDNVNFRTDRFTGDGKIRMRVCEPGTDNCSVLGTSGFDPRNAWPGGRTAKVYGETMHEETDMPGTENSPVKFRQIMTKYGGDWQTETYTFCALHTGGAPCAGNPARYHFEWIDTQDKDAFKTWTKPL